MLRALLVRTLALGLLATGPLGCDDDEGDDEGTASMTLPGEDGSGTAGAAVTCPDGDATVEIAGKRACTCDDGQASTQVCLATGEFGQCACEGGW